ncbi:MAG: phenylacetate--CoA ligase [Bacteroidaceae bacterium]|nr:phenylacetate--CoA ligase [Bacteroidaceae bacterium]MBQ7484035.1 phenylacetate--CoA ligase [Bacteroidaceae bacterium]
MIWNKAKETMSRDEMHDLQGKRLVKLVKYVYTNVKFYREKMQALGIEPGDIHGIEDIVKLPFTTKQDLRDNYPYGLQAAPASEIVRVHASSGTTGNPTIVGYTQKDIEIWAECVSRCLGAAGMSKEDTFSVSYGYGLFTGGLGLHYGVENIGAAVVPTSTGNTEKHLRLMRDLKITGTAATPSYMLYLAETMEKMGIKKEDLSLKAALCGAEPWTENMRQEIQNKLGLKMYNIYGLSEVLGPGVSYECECQNGSHICEDHFFPEIIDPDTLEPLPYGQQGELVFTTLTKEGMPVLRYRTRDISSLMIDECPCGRKNIKMGSIMGRSDDMLIIRGINVFPSQVESVILSLPEFEPRYMIIVDRVNNLDTIQVQVEVRKEFYSTDTVKELALKKKLAAKLQSVIAIKADIKIMAPGSIERYQGKSVRVIDNRAIKNKFTK